MYNFDNTLVSYQDPRCIERRDVYSSRPSYFVSKQKTMQNNAAQSTFYQTKDNEVRRVFQPQKNFTRTLTASPKKFGSTTYSLGSKRQYSNASPIMKVTTQKQVYYPGFQNESEEIIEVQQPSYAPAYTKSHYQNEQRYSSPNHRQGYGSSSQMQGYSNLYNEGTGYSHDNQGYHHGRESDHHRTNHRNKSQEHFKNNSHHKNRSKKHDQLHQTYYVPTSPIKYESIPVMPTQTLVPMYSQVPLYQSPATYTTFHPVATTYSAGKQNLRKSGKL